METKTLSSAIKKIAISYILIYVHVNISVIDILPDWLGYFLIVSVLPVISEKEKSAQLLKPFGIAIGVWNILENILSLMGAEWNLTIISLVFNVVTIYFHFQLITNIANLDIEEAKKKRLLNLRTATVLLHTVTSLALLVPTLFDIDYEIYSYFVIVMLIPQLVICIWISFELFKISKDMKEKEVELSETTEETADSVEETSDNE